jgi:hypothetical protein
MPVSISLCLPIETKRINIYLRLTLLPVCLLVETIFIKGIAIHPHTAHGHDSTNNHDFNDITQLLVLDKFQDYF